MPLLKVSTSGSFAKTETFLKTNMNKNYDALLRRYGQRGVDLLRAATPKDSGKTADAWSYKIVETQTGTRLEWHNSSVNDNVSIVLVLVYGHACQNGTYVEGVNFVNPALEPLFKDLSKKLIREVN